MASCHWRRAGFWAHLLARGIRRRHCGGEGEHEQPEEKCLQRAHISVFRRRAPDRLHSSCPERRSSAFPSSARSLSQVVGAPSNNRPMPGIYRKVLTPRRLNRRRKNVDVAPIWASAPKWLGVRRLACPKHSLGRACLRAQCAPVVCGRKFNALVALRD